MHAGQLYETPFTELVRVLEGRVRSMLGEQSIPQLRVWGLGTKWQPPQSGNQQLLRMCKEIHPHYSLTHSGTPRRRRGFLYSDGPGDEIFTRVRHVFSSEEVDLTINLVGIQSKSTRSGQRLGNAISIAVTKPCTWKLGSNSYDTLQGQWIQVGYDNQEVIISIVSTVDIEGIEHSVK
jgi:hypothetical protein